MTNQEVFDEMRARGIVERVIDLTVDPEIERLLAEEEEIERRSARSADDHILHL